MPEHLSEGTKVRILRYPKRPEFADKEAEIGNYSEKEQTYECWLIDEELEGTYALCLFEDIEVVKEEAPAADGEKACFGVGDRVRGIDSGKLGKVVSVDADGDPKIILDEGDGEAAQRFGKEFEVVEKAKVFAVGDRVRGNESGKLGVVTAVDEDGDPKVMIDGEDEPKQRWAKEFEVVRKSGDQSQSRSRSGDKKKKKKKKSSSSSSRSSSSSGKKKKKKNKRKRSSSSGSRGRLKSSGGFGRSAMEEQEDRKRELRKFQRKSQSGADAALAHLGLR